MWSLRFASAGQKSLHELQEFFLTIYPHTQLGGAKRVVSVYARGQLAAAGRPNGEDEGIEENEEESGSESGEGEEGGEGGDDDSDTESRSSSDSNSGSKSGCEDEKGETQKIERIAAFVADVPLFSTASGVSALSAPIAITASPLHTAPAADADVKSGDAERAAVRKRRAVEDTEINVVGESPIVDAAVAMANVGATKRRRR